MNKQMKRYLVLTFFVICLQLTTFFNLHVSKSFVSCGGGAQSYYIYFFLTTDCVFGTIPQGF